MFQGLLRFLGFAADGSSRGGRRPFSGSRRSGWGRSNRSEYELPTLISGHSDHELDMLLVLGGLQLVLSRATPFALRSHRRCAAELAALIEQKMEARSEIGVQDAAILLDAMHEVGHLLDPLSRQILRNLFDQALNAKKTRPGSSMARAVADARSPIFQPTEFLDMHAPDVGNTRFRERATGIKNLLAEKRRHRSVSKNAPVLRDFLNTRVTSGANRG